MNNIDLYNGDCLEVMDNLISQNITVDAIITDPPFGMTACKWDSVIPFDKMWERLNKLIKPNGAIVLFGSEPFSSALRMSNIKNYKYDWVWEKNNHSGFAHAKNMPLKKHENICIFSLGKTIHKSQSNNRMEYNPQGLIYKPRIVKNKKRNNKGSESAFGDRPSHQEKYAQEYTNYPNSVLKFDVERGLHPTQKPVALMEYLIKTYTNENETVLDFTMGSGTTMLACKNTNRKGIGIELDKNYFEIAEKRCL